MSTASDIPVGAVDVPTSRALFIGFMYVGIQGFGGVLPFARRMLVEQHRWLTEREFTEVLSLSQFLPGPNIINVAIIVGNRFRGPLGSLAASVGLMLMPFIIVLVLAALYARFAGIERVRGATTGVSAAATGLIIALGFRMAGPMRRIPWQIVVAMLAFVTIAVLRVPLLWALAAIAPASVAFAWWAARR
jgi:chromate transporter